MRQINFADHLEQQIAEALHDAGIDFIHESEADIFGLDFYLPAYDLFIEVKQYHSDRIAAQMSRADNVIAVQGKQSVQFLIDLLKAQK